MNNNNNKNKPARQRKTTYNQRLLNAQSTWEKEAIKLAQEKEELGYKKFTTEDFLQVQIYDFEDELKSKIIDLQNRYQDHLDQKFFLWAEDIVVDDFNKYLAVVHLDQTYILTEKINEFGESDFSLESRQSFKAFYEDETIICFDGIERSKAEIWLKSPKRRKYKGIVFDPTTTRNNGDYYNIWKGFARTPRQGSCLKYWDHVRDNICNGDETIFRYLRRWLAYVFQRPHVVHTAIVLQGSQGVGKNSFVEPLGVLLGSHYAPLSSIAELVSNFNYHLKNAVLIHANEALWGGNRKDIGTLKAMITEEFCLIEGKGKDRIKIRNFKHVILSSNEDWPVHLDSDDRRFVVLKVADNQKENHEYFKAIRDELEQGGYEALLYDLVHEELTHFDPRKIPMTNNSFEIKMRSAESSHRYLYEVLCVGGFTIGIENADEITVGQKKPFEVPAWQSIIDKSLVYKDYKAWCTNNGETSQANTLFSKVLHKMIVSVSNYRPSGNGRARCYKFATLRQSQIDFAKSFKADPSDIFENYIEDVVHYMVQDDES